MPLLEQFNGYICNLKDAPSSAKGDQRLNYAENAVSFKPQDILLSRPLKTVSFSSCHEGDLQLTVIFVNLYYLTNVPISFVVGSYPVIDTYGKLAVKGTTNFI